MIKHLLFSILLAVLLVGCSDDPRVTSTEPPTDSSVETQTPVAYQYTAYNSSGRIVVKGILLLTLRDPAHVVGQWRLRPLADTALIGPQYGIGRLTGEMRGDMLHVNLNPSNVDNNVVLSGQLSRSSFSGRWEWIGFPGVIASGRFSATRARTAEAIRVE